MIKEEREETRRTLNVLHTILLRRGNVALAGKVLRLTDAMFDITEDEGGLLDQITQELYDAQIAQALG